MNNDTDVNRKIMQDKIDSNEKVISAGLAGHKAELAGFKESVDRRFEATRELINSNHQAILGEFKAIRAEFSGEFKAIRAEFSGEFKAIRAEFSGGLKAIREQFKVVHTEIQAVRAENKHQNEAVRVENKQRIEAFRAESKQQIEAIRAESKQQIEANRADIRAIFLNLKIWIVVEAIALLVLAFAIRLFFFNGN